MAHVTFTDQDEVRLAAELAEAAKITPNQATKVLHILHVSKLKENLDALTEIMGNPKASNALGFSEEGARELSDLLTERPIGLNSLRIGIKAPNKVSGPHA